MPKIHIRAVGRIGSGWAKEACAEYTKRLSVFGGIEIVELPEGHKGSITPDITRTRLAESESLLKNISEQDMVIALNETGNEYTSVQFADLISSCIMEGKNIVFVIGGSWGLDKAVLARANKKLSFGRMTYPHSLARVILLEQIYRAKMIASGREYHK